MKNSKLRRVLLLMACAVLLVCLSVGATLAYLTSTTGVVQNTFTVGNVTLDDPTTELQDGLDEALVNEYGQPINNDTDQTVVDIKDAPRVLTNDYKLVANKTYTKDPTVHVQKGSEPCYVRMIVKITAIDELEVICGDPFNPGTFVEGWYNTTWEYQGNEVKSNVGYYEFWYVETANDTVDARQAKVDMPPLFTAIKVPATATNDQLKALKDAGFQIEVVAQAVQAEGFANQAAAWAVIDRPANFTFDPVAPVAP